MKIIGLTGGSGAGKGEVCKAFLNYGIESIDTDRESREVTRKGSDCLKELVENFSGIILTANGELDRKKLADIAFKSEEKVKLLNSITHKYILEKCQRWIIDRKNANREAVIVDAPLLFESGFDKNCDVIISVLADIDKRIERIIKRDNLTEEQAMLRIKNQKDDKFFMEHSDYIIYNNGSYSDILIQVENIVGNGL